jgi:hypothetical protein
VLFGTQEGKQYMRTSFRVRYRYIAFVNNYVCDLLVSKPPRAVKASIQTRHPKWLPPPAGCTKVNIDAAISKNLGRASVAAVARD